MWYNLSMTKVKGKFYKLNTSTHKVCSKCGIKKERSEYYNDSSRNDGITSYCKECTRSKTDKWRKENPEKVNQASIWYRRERTYGITEEDFMKMIDNQKWECAVCKKSIDESCHVDHNHENGKVRGLLCDSCNKGLGFFKDNVEHLASAIKYLSK